MEVMHNLAHLALKQSAIVQCKTVIVIAYLPAHDTHLVVKNGVLRTLPPGAPTIPCSCLEKAKTLTSRPGACDIQLLSHPQWCIHLIIIAVSQYTCRLTSAFRYYAPKTNQDSRVNSGCNPGYGRVLCLTLRTFQESLSSLAYASSICIAKHSAPCLDR